MKIRRRSITVVVALIALLGLVTDDSTSSPANWSALSKVDALKKTLQDAGFSLQPGQFTYWDLVQATCQGEAPRAGNNPWPSVYLSVELPQGTGDTSQMTRYWQLGEDEAVVLVGQTPPSVRYFGYQTVAVNLPGIQHPMFIAVGDAINNGTINTIGPDKYNKPIVYIVTGNRETERRVRAAALKAGYPEAIINVETISPVIAPLGVGEGGSWFALAHRLAAPLDKIAVEDYGKNPPYQAFRVTPDWPLKDDPEPVPVLRVRGTGHTEMPMYPSLKKLRQAILNEYAGMEATELDTKIPQMTFAPDNHEVLIDKPFASLQRGVDAWGVSRDNANLNSYPSFRLRDGVDEFAIVYGANHQTTGKATYASFTLYVDEDRWFGLKDSTITSNNYDADGKPGDSARRYLCPRDASQCPSDVQYLYAWKIARHCNGEPYCMELKAEFVDKDGQTYACNLYDWYKDPTTPIGPFDLDAMDVFVNWRTYMEPATNVGPDDNELLYDRAIYFGPNAAKQ